MFNLRLFGSPVLERGDRAFTGRAVQRHRLALLALLALAPGRRLSRDKLIAYLWPERDTLSARNLLKVSTHVLRTELAEDVLLSETDQLRLNEAVVRVDATEFSAALASLDYARAVALYRGPFLDGFFLDHAAEFEEWAARERQRLADGYGGALEALAVAAETDGAPLDAVAWWRRRAAHDPCNGRVALRLMNALEAAGDRAGALQHARIHVTLLREEFDADPDADVMAYVERLRNEPPPAPNTAPSPEPPRPSPPASSSGPEKTSAAPAPVAPPASLPRQGTPAPRRRRLAIWAAAALTLAFALALSYNASRSAAPAPARSVGVLPFVNMSPDPANTYFSDGLSEQIILALSRIDGLRVAARTSSFALRNRDLSVTAIGDTLGVQAVLEGSVLVNGESLRVIAQLIDARTGYHIWSERYDGDLRDAFAVQDRVAASIADALHLRLSGPTAAVADGRPPSLDAYDLYLRGLYLRNTLSADGLQQAEEYFDRALELEPHFARALAAKASVIAPQAYFRYTARDTVVAELRTLTARALELDPTIGEAYASLGILKLFFDWDWDGARAALLRAIELNPNDAHAWHHLANYYSAVGSMEEAIAAREKSVQLDPLNARTRIVLGNDYLITGRHERALEHFQRAAQLDPVNPLLLGTGPGRPAGAGQVYLTQGRTAEAVEELVRVATLRRATVEELNALRAAYAASGMPGFWQSWLNMDLRQSGPAPDPVRMAAVHMTMGDTAQALDWLDRAFAERNPGLIYLNRDPDFGPVLSHPRVRRISAEMKFPN